VFHRTVVPHVLRAGLARDYAGVLALVTTDLAAGALITR
jgi:hypothetical protein